jgi:monoamine oxidase
VLTASHPSSPLPVELGAEFVHGDAPHTERLAAAAGAVIADIAGEHWRARHGRVTRQHDFWDRVASVMRLLDDAREPDRSFGDFLRTSPGGRRLAPARTLARSFVQGFHAADIHRISERVLASAGAPAEHTSAARHGRLSTGYGPLLQQLARPVSDRIDFGAVAERVVWRRGAAAVHVRGGAVHEARAVVITVPLPLLQARSPALDPEPAAVRRALERLVMGSVVRVSFVCRERFWEDDDVVRGVPASAIRHRLSFVHTPHDAFNIWWTAHPLRAPVITGWSGGPPARQLAAAGDVEAAASAALARALGLSRRRLDKLIVAAFTHDWEADPFSRGAYSYAAVGGAGAAAVLARPLEGTVFIAGEATDEEQNGTVEGALASGARAARQVLRALGLVSPPSDAGPS